MSENNQNASKKVDEIVEQLKDLVKKGNVSRIYIKKDDEIILNLPMNAGIASGLVVAIAAPWALIATAITTIGFDCKVEIQKTDGTLVDVSGKTIGQNIKKAFTDGQDD